VAVRAWRKVQVLRPSVSTSGGQSEFASGGVGMVVVDGEGVWAATGGLEEVWAFVIAAQDANDMQDRQLQLAQVSKVDARLRVGNTHGLPSFPRTTPLGNFLGSSVLAEAVFELEA
jgi:hypothetical protein